MADDRHSTIQTKQWWWNGGEMVVQYKTPQSRVAPQRTRHIGSYCWCGARDRIRSRLILVQRVHSLYTDIRARKECGNVMRGTDVLPLSTPRRQTLRHQVCLRLGGGRHRDRPSNFGL